MMKCVICRNGETESGHVTVTLHREQTTIVIKDVPAQVCENCGEYYLSEDVSASVLKLGEEAVRHNAEIEVVKFAA